MTWNPLLGHEKADRPRAHQQISFPFPAQLESEASQDMVTVEQTEGFLTVVDLAGSERLKRSQSEGARKVEATNINLSLFTLGQCVQALASKRPHVPYRDSVLTRILEANLSGHCRTCLLVCFAPERENVSETISTLDFASRAMTIEVVPEKRTMSVRMSVKARPVFRAAAAMRLAFFRVTDPLLTSCLLHSHRSSQRR